MLEFQPLTTLKLGMCIMEHLEVLEYSGIFISNPEHRILFRNNLFGAKWAVCAEVCNADQRSFDLLISSLRHYTTQCCELVECLFISLTQERKECTAKFIGSVCFANFAIFHVYLIHIHLKSKYSRKFLFLDSTAEGLESIGFDIPLYASLIETKVPLISIGFLLFSIRTLTHLNQCVKL